MGLAWKQERDDAFYEQTILGRLLIRLDLAQFTVRYVWPERFWRGLAWHLPRKLVLWSFVRVAGHASSGQWGNTHPDDLTYSLMHQRWEDEQHGR